LSRRVNLHPAAEEEMEAAFDWYWLRSERAAARFLQELSAMVERVRNSPHQFPQFDPKTRRAALHRFPFSLIFRETERGIQIIAVAHSKRRPGYWRNRQNK
jgi:toxin ParE1/3/4